MLELNASDERGIDVVRNKVRHCLLPNLVHADHVALQIKTFAQGQVSQQVVNGRQLPPFKLIILDEVDQMTSDAQNALRRVIEIYSHVTRFALLCNYVSKIIDPITSRCAKFRFQPLPHEPVKARLESIVTAEKLMTDQTSAQIELFLDALIRLSEGDLRKAITYLQSAYRLYGSHMSLQALNDIAGVVPEEQIRALFAACRSKSFKEVQREVETLVDDGYSTAQVLKQLAEQLIRSAEVDDVRKSRALLHFAESDKALVDGADELLQLLAVTTSTMRVLQQV